MTRQQQAQFIHELTGSVRQEMLGHVKAGRVPGDWDGIELRWWIADHFEKCQFKGAGSVQRLRQYHIDVTDGRLL
jgi:hypothetical protein